MSYLLALDQGTTGTRAIIFDMMLQQVCVSYLEHRQIYPHAGWVEHDPEEILRNCLKASGRALAEAEQLGIPQSGIAALGIANQGETVMVWDRATGKPVHNAIVWSCRRTAEDVDGLRRRPGFAEQIRSRTGLILDAYFSAPKISWILERIDGLRGRLADGGLLAGTMDSWIIWKLTAGKSFVTDVSTASRTMLFNIHTLDWDEEILRAFGVPREILPRVLPTSGVFGTTDPAVFHGLSIPIAGSVVDQYGALFAEDGCAEGAVKCTYGTGCFVQMNIGDTPVIKGDSILTSIGWQLAGQVSYVLDGAVYVAGAALRWLRDELRLITDYNEVDGMASRAGDTDGVFFVPAFSGLAAPVWDQHARGLIIGLTSRTTREHIVRATLESIAYQVRDVLDTMAVHAKQPLTCLRVDGGVTRSEFLMQFQADMLGLPVVRAGCVEASALGAALFAGLGIGLWASVAEARDHTACGRRYLPRMDRQRRDSLMSSWREAVNRSLHWTEVLAGNGS